jgi:hypothetical protein
MTEECITPLRRRMIEDMSARHFASKTQHDYIRTVMKLTRFLGRSPDTATNEDLRRFQLHDQEPRGSADYQLHRFGVAVLFHRDARSGRRGSASGVRPRAAQAAGRLEPRGGRPPRSHAGAGVPSPPCATLPGARRKARLAVSIFNNDRDIALSQNETFQSLNFCNKLLQFVCCRN